MKIVVIGAGAMGSLFGAMLSAVSDVVLVDPYAAHVEKINESGLTLITPEGAAMNFRIPAATDPAAVSSLFSLTDFEAALIFTKSHKTREAAETAKTLLSRDGVALTLQNGVGNRETIAEILGDANTLAGVTAHGATLLGPGKVRHAGKGETHIGRPQATRPIFDALVNTFGAAGIETEVTENVDGLIWGKLIVNVGINALAAILKVPNGALAEVTECKRLMTQAVAEAVAVAEARNITLPQPNPQEHVAAVAEATANNRASMLQDILRGAKTEIDVINRAVVRYGESVDIPTPVNRLLSEIIEALEKTTDRRIG